MTGKHAKPASRDEYQWHILGFLPAECGWIAYYLEPDKEIRSVPIAGWLMREIVAYDRLGLPRFDYQLADRPPRQVVAAIQSNGEIVSAVDVDWFWQIRGPYEGHPTDKEIETERDRRTRMNRARDAIAHAKSEGGTQ